MRTRLKDHELAALLCERWGMWTFKKGVRAHVPIVDSDGNLGGFTAVTPRSLRALVKRLRAAGK